jgi:hypothetical protein
MPPPDTTQDGFCFKDCIQKTYDSLLEYPRSWRRSYRASTTKEDVDNGQVIDATARIKFMSHYSVQERQKLIIE